MKKPQLSAHLCPSHSGALFSVLSKPYVRKWGVFIKDFEDMAVCLQRYSEFLEKQNKEQKTRQTRSYPCRQVRRCQSTYVSSNFVTYDCTYMYIIRELMIHVHVLHNIGYYVGGFSLLSSVFWLMH